MIRILRQIHDTNPWYESWYEFLVRIHDMNTWYKSWYESWCEFLRRILDTNHGYESSYESWHESWIRMRIRILIRILDTNPGYKAWIRVHDTSPGYDAMIFAGPSAHGVLDPLIIPCPMSLWPVPVLNPLGLLWGALGAADPKSVVPGGSLLLLAVGRDFSYYCSRSGINPARPQLCIFSKTPDFGKVHAICSCASS